MTCPYCNSTNVKEKNDEIYESNPEEYSTGFDPFAIKTLYKLAKSIFQREKQSKSGKKIYICYDCHKLFEEIDYE
jgi:DNA-directed RNA polymerase subunit RPC12/RpoP